MSKKTNPELMAVVNHQQSIRNQKELCDTLRTAIVQHEQIIIDSATFTSSLEELQEKREGLLADKAMGASNKPELAAVDAAIISENKRIASHKEKVSGAVSESTAAVSGLRRKLVTAEAEYENIRSLKPAILRAFLKSHMEEIGVEYATYASLVCKKYLLILAARNLYRNAGGKGADTLRELSLPLFALEAHKGLEKNGWHGYLAESVDVINDRNFLDRATKAMSDEIKMLGVEL